MKLIILDDYQKVSEWTAKYIRKRINAFKPGPDRYFTLGLPTGSTPLGTYQKLIQFYRYSISTIRYFNPKFSISSLSLLIAYQLTSIFSLFIN